MRWTQLLRLASTLALTGLLHAAGHAAETAVAQPGDGIIRLLQRHGFSSAADQKEFIRLNQDSLGPNQTLLKGKPYRLPNRSANVQPLFGPKLAQVKRLDNRLSGAAFYLISGHGGPDPGAIGRAGSHRLYEDEYAYDITLRLGRRLMEHGAKVHFIIQDHRSGIQDDPYLPHNQTEVCYPNQKIPLNQLARLRQRTQAANKLYRSDAGAAYRRCIVIHIDSRRKSEEIDIFFYHHRSSTLGKRMARTMRGTIEEKYRINQPGRGYDGTVEPRGLYVINNITPPVVFIELGNIQQKRDQARLIEPNNRQAIANWLCEGIQRDAAKSL